MTGQTCLQWNGIWISPNYARALLRENILAFQTSFRFNVNTGRPLQTSQINVRASWIDENLRSRTNTIPHALLDEQYNIWKFESKSL